jgi:hypothetical protein
MNFRCPVCLNPFEAIRDKGTNECTYYHYVAEGEKVYVYDNTFIFIDHIFGRSNKICMAYRALGILDIFYDVYGQTFHIKDIPGMERLDWNT